MKKKGIIILSVVSVIVLGFLASCLFDWPVDTDSASGNIAKSSRFSRKTSTESIANMEELLRNDEEYRNGVVMAYSLMQTRAMQFSALVDMSNQVAGSIPEFEGVLKDMNDAVPIITNVSESLAAAGEDLNCALEGEPCKNLEQNTINASLAYSTLQKQNEIANRFIATTDKYQQKAKGSDELKFVRDQWMDYQKMTAALEGNEKAGKQLQEKGTLLNAEQTKAALNAFDGANQLSLLLGSALAREMQVDNILIKAIPAEVVMAARKILPQSASEAISLVNKDALGSYLLPQEAHDVFRLVAADQLALASGNAISSMAAPVEAPSRVRPIMNLNAADALQRNMVLANDAAKEALNGSLLCIRINKMIEAVALGNVETLALKEKRRDPIPPRN